MVSGVFIVFGKALVSLRVRWALGSELPLPLLPNARLCSGHKVFSNTKSASSLPAKLGKGT